MACRLVGAKPLSFIFIQENAFENVVWKKAAICLGLNELKKQAGIWTIIKEI